MPTALRDLVERTIRDSLPELASELGNGGSGNGGGDEEGHEDEHGEGGEAPLSPTELALEAEFVGLGFRKGHVLKALAYARTSSSSSSSSPNPQALRHSVLSNLHLLVPESDLPPSFRDSRPADATIRNATSRDSESLGRMWRAEKVSKEVGVPVEWVEEEIKGLRGAAGGEEGGEKGKEERERDEADLEGKVVDLLVRRLMDDGGGSDTIDVEERQKLGEEELKQWWTTAPSLSPSEQEELSDRRKDELLGLEGLYGNRFRHTPDGSGVEIAIFATPKKGVNPSARLDIVTLRVLFHPSSLYPSPSEAPTPAHLPTFFVSSPTLPPYIRLHLLHLSASQFLPSSPSGGTPTELAEAGYGGVIAELVAFLEDTIRGVIENPPDARGVMDRLEAPEKKRARAAQDEAERAKGGRTVKSQQQGGRRRAGGRREPSREEHEKLKREFERLQGTEGWRKMREQRMRLPAWGMKEEIVELVRKSRVVIVCGETGSGKTTQGAPRLFSLSLSLALFRLPRPFEQHLTSPLFPPRPFPVPAFILEDAILRGEGASTSLVITQPRRVSAIGVASRVANERCEDVNSSAGNGLVGYAIRGERRAGPGCRALFCTTGVVLARLSRGGDPDLEGISHIFIDEVRPVPYFLLRNVAQSTWTSSLMLLRTGPRALRRLRLPPARVGRLLEAESEAQGHSRTAFSLSPSPSRILTPRAYADVGYDQPGAVLKLLRRRALYRDPRVRPLLSPSPPLPPS